MGFVLFIMFFCMGIAILLSIPMAIIGLFFPKTHPWYIFCDKHFCYHYDEEDEKNKEEQ